MGGDKELVLFSYTLALKWHNILEFLPRSWNSLQKGLKQRDKMVKRYVRVTGWCWTGSTVKLARHGRDVIAFIELEKKTVSEHVGAP